MPETASEYVHWNGQPVPSTLLAGAWGADIAAAFRDRRHAECRQALQIVDEHLRSLETPKELVTALATGLLEAIWNPMTDPERREFVALCGPKSLEYLRTWDAVWGVHWTGENGPS